VRNETQEVWVNTTLNETVKRNNSLSATIESISFQGLMTVRFSNKMLQTNLTALNQTIEVSLNNSKVDHNVTYLNDDALQVQLYFTKPSSVSPDQVQDQIQLNLTKANAQGLLFSPFELCNLGPDYEVLQKKVRR
jgi:hypothetical protein